MYYDFIINDGKLHERFTYVGWYQPPYAVDKDYEISGFTFMGIGQQIFYDNKHMQFLQRSSWPPNAFTPVDVPEGYFSQLKLQYADRGFAGTDYPHYFCVFRDVVSGDSYYVEVVLDMSGLTVRKKEKLDFRVEEDMPFAASYTTPALFYAKDAVLYSYDTGNGASVARYNRLDPQKERITGLYLLPQYGDLPGHPGETGLLRVKLFMAVSTPGAEREGSVYEFEVNADNSLTLIRKKEHFAGRIVSMAWKY